MTTKNARASRNASSPRVRKNGNPAPVGPAIPADARMMTCDASLRARLDDLFARIPALAVYNTRPETSAVSPARFYSVSFGNTENDIPALLDLAARLCRSVGADAGPVDAATVPPANTLEPLYCLYSNHRASPAVAALLRRDSCVRKIPTQFASDIDRNDTVARVCAAIVADCDRLAHRTVARDATGSFGTSDYHAHVVHGIAFHVRTMRAAVAAANP